LTVPGKGSFSLMISPTAIATFACAALPREKSE
jgi:hypothetical protein